MPGGGARGGCLADPVIHRDDAAAEAPEAVGLRLDRQGVPRRGAERVRAERQKLVAGELDDWPKLGGSILNSLKLLAVGYVVGSAFGFALGVAIGSSRAVGYWAHPVLRFVGPLPATAWLPLAFFIFPSS